MHCIGVDVSKQELVTFDGSTERVFPNTRGRVPGTSLKARGLSRGMLSFHLLVERPLWRRSR